MERLVEAAPAARAGDELDSAGLAVAPEQRVRGAAQLAGLDHAPVGQAHQRAGGDVEAGFDDAVVAQADADTGLGAQQAALPDLHGAARVHRAHVTQ